MGAPKGCFFGRLLEVDLSSGKIAARTVDEAVYQNYLGGIGLGAYLLFSELKPGTDALSPDNLLCFLPGPFNGTSIPASRLNVSFKSPLTGIYGHSQVGGHISNEFKWAGWDGVIIRGKSPKPVYLYIQDDKAELRDAAPIWGKDTYVADEWVKEDVKNPDAKVILIGPAGENGVLYSALIVDRTRAAGRSGGGAVMGSKNLKAVAVSGTKAVPLVHVDAYKKAADEVLETARKVEAWDGIKRLGTAVLMENANYNTGTLTTKNFQTSWFADVNRIGAAEAYRHFWKRHVACANCPVHCMKVGVMRTAGFEGLIAEGPEYETGAMVGSNLMVSDLDALMKNIEFCDAMGLDTISTGNVLGFVMELVDRGLLDRQKDLDGLDLVWGNSAAVYQAIDAIAHRKGKVGALCAQGVKRMADAIGGEAPKYAMQVKGQELAAHDPRGFRGRGVSYAMGQRGGCHHEGNDPAGQAVWAMIGSLCMCTFVAGVPLISSKKNPQIICDLLNAGAGWNWTPETYWTTAKRLITLQRAFNIREKGVSRADDRLPERFKEPLPEGPKKGEAFTEEHTKKMQDDYYAFFGWNDNGIPTEETMKKLGLDFAVAAVKK